VAALDEHGLEGGEGGLLDRLGEGDDEHGVAVALAADQALGAQLGDEGPDVAAPGLDAEELVDAQAAGDSEAAEDLAGVGQ
jgi:hypothetical protein